MSWLICLSGSVKLLSAWNQNGWSTLAETLCFPPFWRKHYPRSLSTIFDRWSYQVVSRWWLSLLIGYGIGLLLLACNMYIAQRLWQARGQQESWSPGYWMRLKIAWASRIHWVNCQLVLLAASSRFGHRLWLWRFLMDGHQQDQVSGVHPDKSNLQPSWASGSSLASPSQPCQQADGCWEAHPLAALLSKPRRPMPITFAIHFAGSWILIWWFDYLYTSLHQSQHQNCCKA